MPVLRQVLVGIGLGVGVATYLACAPPPPVKAMRDVRAAKMQEILERWGNIQNWRHQAGMGVDPKPAAVVDMSNRSVKEARRRVCESGHEIPKACSDICGIADDICDNAERICVLAKELGEDDVLAQDKCSSAKASCREATQNCCSCSTGAAAAPPDGGKTLP